MHQNSLLAYAEEQTHLSTREQDAEIWKAIPEYEGVYEASSLGRIRRVAIYRRTSIDGVLKTFTPTNGYPRATLTRNNKRRDFSVHVLIAATFIGPRPGNPRLWPVNHKNGIKSDNRAENLEYCTVNQNAQHAVDMSLNPLKGEGNHRCRISEKRAREILALGARGFGCAYLSRVFGLSKTHVSEILTGKVWRHIDRSEYQVAKKIREAAPFLYSALQTYFENPQRFELEAKQALDLARGVQKTPPTLPVVDVREVGNVRDMVTGKSVRTVSLVEARG